MEGKIRVDNILPDKVDIRDYFYKSSGKALPSKFNLREFTGDIEDQLQTGSCVANATVSGLEMLKAKDGVIEDYSRLFLYYNLREPYEDLKGKDIGSHLRDGFKSVSKLGICLENEWEFNPSKIHERPDESCYESAKKRLVTRYERINIYNDSFLDKELDSIEDIKDAVYNGFAVTISCNVGRSLYNIRANIKDHNYLGVNGDSVGGHAMLVIGWDDELGGLIVENSWGKAWGDNGEFLFKYGIFLKDANDVWVCTEFDKKEIVEPEQPVNPVREITEEDKKDKTNYVIVGLLVAIFAIYMFA